MTTLSVANSQAVLEQPDGSYRFAVDAPLLARFCADTGLAAGDLAADLGCGCGVVGLQIARLVSGVRVVGLDCDPQLVKAAMNNAAMLEVSAYTALCGDVADETSLQCMKEAGARLVDDPDATGAAHFFDRVACNPPWRREGTGRLSPSQRKNKAIFADSDTLPAFLNAAEALLRMRGSLCLVYAASGVKEVLDALPQRLRPVKLQFVHGKPGKKAVFMLLEAVKGSRAPLEILPPVILHGKSSP